MNNFHYKKKNCPSSRKIETISGNKLNKNETNKKNSIANNIENLKEFLIYIITNYCVKDDGQSDIIEQLINNVNQATNYKRLLLLVHPDKTSQLSEHNKNITDELTKIINDFKDKRMSGGKMRVKGIKKSPSVTTAVVKSRMRRYISPSVRISRSRRAK